MNVQTLKFDEDGRYFVLIQFAEDVDMEIVAGLDKALNEWWKNGNKFRVLGWTNNPSFIKIDKSDE